MRKLTTEIKETVSLSVPIGTKLVYFDRIEFHWPMQLNLEAGDHLPLHASASGKLYLSSIKKEDALKIFNNIKTPKSAKNTITDISQFKKELNKINKQGYAFDDEEWFNGSSHFTVFSRNHCWIDKAMILSWSSLLIH